MSKDDSINQSENDSPLGTNKDKSSNQSENDSPLGTDKDKSSNQPLGQSNIPSKETIKIEDNSRPEIYNLSKDDSINKKFNQSQKGASIQIKTGKIEDIKTYFNDSLTRKTLEEMTNVAKRIESDGTVVIENLISENQIKYLGSKSNREIVSIQLGEDLVYFWKSTGGGGKYKRDKDGYYLNAYDKRIVDNNSRLINNELELEIDSEDPLKKPVSTANSWYPFPGFGVYMGYPYWIIKGDGYDKGYGSTKLETIAYEILPEVEKKFEEQMLKHDIESKNLSYKKIALEIERSRSVLETSDFRTPAHKASVEYKLKFLQKRFDYLEQEIKNREIVFDEAIEKTESDLEQNEARLNRVSINIERIESFASSEPSSSNSIDIGSTNSNLDQEDNRKEWLNLFGNAIKSNYKQLVEISDPDKAQQIKEFNRFFDDLIKLQTASTSDNFNLQPLLTIYNNALIDIDKNLKEKIDAQFSQISKLKSKLEAQIIPDEDNDESSDALDDKSQTQIQLDLATEKIQVLEEDRLKLVTLISNHKNTLNQQIQRTFDKNISNLSDPLDISTQTINDLIKLINTETSEINRVAKPYRIKK